MKSRERVSGTHIAQGNVQADIQLWEELIKGKESGDDDDGEEEPNEDKEDLKDVLGESGPVDKALLDYFLVPVNE